MNPVIGIIASLVLLPVGLVAAVGGSMAGASACRRQPIAYRFSLAVIGTPLLILSATIFTAFAYYWFFWRGDLMPVPS
jgi:hypothetical protein